jgi:DNA-binding NarL/FixJ family response regulator
VDRLRVALYASDPMTMAGIASHLRARPDLQVLTERQNAEAEVFVVATEHVTREAITVLQNAAHSSAPKIILIIDELRETDLKSAIEYGVVAVLPRHRVTGEQIVATITALDRSKGQPPAELLGRLLAQVERVQRDVLRPKGLAEPLLATREKDVLRLLADGLDTAAIAERLCYSERTVKNIVQAVLSRLQLRNRAHAVAYAMRVGVI